NMVRCRLAVFSVNGMPDRSSRWVILSVSGIGSLNDELLIIAPSPDYTPDPNRQHSLARSEFSPGARSLELCRLRQSFAVKIVPGKMVQSSALVMAEMQR